MLTNERNEAGSNTTAAVFFKNNNKESLIMNVLERFYIVDVNLRENFHFSG